FRPGGEPEQGYFGCRSSLTRKRAATGSAEIEHLFWNINRVIATDSSSIARGEIHVDLHPEMIFWGVGEGEVIQVRGEKCNLRAHWVRERIDPIISVGIPLLSILVYFYHHAKTCETFQRLKLDRAHVFGDVQHRRHINN